MDSIWYALCSCSVVPHVYVCTTYPTKCNYLRDSYGSIMMLSVSLFFFWFHSCTNSIKCTQKESL